MTSPVPPMILHGKRWGWIAGAVMTGSVGLSLFALIIFDFLPPVSNSRIAAIAATAAFMLMFCVDSTIKIIRPNRIVLTEEGLELITAYRSRFWPWTRFVGFFGWWHRVLLVKTDFGWTRRIGIGHWNKDFGPVVRDFTRTAGIIIPALADEKVTPSPAPLFIVSGLIVATVLAFLLS